MRKCWLVYILMGLLFGWVDWYFLDLLASFSRNQTLSDAVFQIPGIIQLLIVAIVISLNYGVWLIPAIPFAIYEMRCSHSLWRAALSAILVWCMALLSYYAYYAFLLMFVGLPNLDFMLFSNRHSVTYWADWWPPFRRMIVYQLVEWIGIGIIGGAVVGTMSASLYARISKKRIEKAALVKQITA
jgi:hypothetical protein